MHIYICVRACVCSLDMSVTFCYMAKMLPLAYRSCRALCYAAMAMPRREYIKSDILAFFELMMMLREPSAFFPYNNNKKIIIKKKNTAYSTGTAQTAHLL